MQTNLYYGFGDYDFNHLAHNDKNEDGQSFMCIVPSVTHPLEDGTRDIITGVSPLEYYDQIEDITHIVNRPMGVGNDFVKQQLHGNHSFHPFFMFSRCQRNRSPLEPQS